MNRFRLSAALVLAATASGAALAASEPPAVAASALSYADLVGLADGAPIVAKVKIKKQVEVEAARAPGLAAGHARLLIDAQTLAVIAGSAPLGESVRYLVDVPRDAKGKVPKLKKREMLLFARTVPGRPGELQLVDPHAQLAWDAETEARLRPILAELAAADAAPRVTAVRDVLSVPGTLVGESETQLFLEAGDEGPVSITVVRRPGMAPVWGVSWSDIVDQSARPPAAQSLAWYRLACALPARLPAGANLATDPQSRALAAKDYAFVLQQLGPCTRNRI